MINLEQIIEELETMDTCEDTLVEDIITAFGDYEFNGNSEVIVSKQQDGTYQAYINEEDAPIIAINPTVRTIVATGESTIVGIGTAWVAE